MKHWHKRTLIWSIGIVAWFALVVSALSIMAGCKERTTEATGFIAANVDFGHAGCLMGLPAVWYVMRRRGRMANAALDRLIQRLEHGKECAMTAQNVVTMVQQHRDETQKWLHRRVKAVTK